MTLSTLTIFGIDLQSAIRIAKAIAKDYHHSQYTPAHLLRACMHKETGLIPALHQMDIDVYYLEEWAEVRLDEMPRASRIPDEPEPDEAAAVVLQEAVNIALENDSNETDAWSLLIALCTPGVGFSYDQLKTFPFTRDQLIAASKKGKSNTSDINSGTQTNTIKPGALKYVYRITDPQLLKTFHPVIGRDGEVRAITEILTRKDRASVLIIGEGGVGKTALAEGLARAIVEKQVPLQLQSSDIYALDYGAFIAGAAYKNELEDRLLQIIQQLKQTGRHILFIDNLHTLLDKQSGGGMANVIKAALGKGEIILIGTTTPEGFRKLIEPDAILRHRFETITLSEPDETQATRMMTAVVPVYENFYQLKVSPEGIHEAIRLSRRYLKERCLPDSAINLLDRTMAAIRAMQDTGSPLLQTLQTEFAALADRESSQHDDLLWFYRQMMERLGNLLSSKLHTSQEVNKITDTAALKVYLQQLLEQLATVVAGKQEEVTPVDLATMIAAITGIPLGKIQSQERERLVTMDLHLRKRVVGQDHALKAVADAILESRSGLSRPGQPIGSFFFLGPTGTGKTELAKSLADFLFQDERCMIRFDMSEFKEEHAAALLYGAPPGYVGYEEGGLLVNKIRQQPYAVVLFDEIEKAHPSVFDIFLQIMDEGKLHDRLGKTGDFSNALVLFTSNIGSDTITKSFQQGIIPPSQQLMELMARHFRPEFLGRLTEIVPFGPIQQENVEKIFDIHLQHLLQLLQQQEINLTVTTAARQYLALMGYSPQYGARPLREVIRGQLRKPLSRMIIDGSLQKGAAVTLDIKDEKLDWLIN
ncbi:ATP-dependent Clp protease ATP-binding subunit ClpA [Chitinophaga niastensis]|uniref:ATP-dependent Clp protease ATP-binding subunit ClpA n=1 Tax=Chitinophaga niastensis TaxID=536980 RepID=A0A2P8HK84_CHINA|nr:ATP-dependent Clp protease ATP-binding subunit [Chitinophaga niastensis]PSL46632.1 ATP-dependent Clp protease ATP-binding subunit ClpA [Chitinophaga niastensis]